MKKVNFISSLSPQKQYEIYRWFWATFFLCICMVVVAAYCIVPQVVTYVSLKKEVGELREKTKIYREKIKNKDALKIDYDALRIRERKVEKYKHHPKNPYQQIAAIVHACGDGVKLELVRVNKKDVEVTVACATAEHAHMFIKRLAAAENFSTIKLASLQHEAQSKKLRCVVKGTVV